MWMTRKSLKNKTNEWSSLVISGFSQLSILESHSWPWSENGTINLFIIFSA